MFFNTTNTTNTTQEIVKLGKHCNAYKFPQLSREEIEAMFTVSELKQTKVYQEALDEGRIADETAILIRLVKQKFGIDIETEEQIRRLSLQKLEALSDVFLSFSDRADLDSWLQQNH